MSSGAVIIHVLMPVKDVMVLMTVQTTLMNTHVVSVEVAFTAGVVVVVSVVPLVVIVIIVAVAGV